MNSLLGELAKGNSRLQLVNIDTGFVQVDITIHPILLSFNFGPGWPEYLPSRHVGLSWADPEGLQQGIWTSQRATYTGLNISSLTEYGCLGTWVCTAIWYLLLGKVQKERKWRRKWKLKIFWGKYPPPHKRYFFWFYVDQKSKEKPNEKEKQLTSAHD